MNLGLLVAKLASYEQFHDVVPFDPQRERLALMDFTASNKDLNEAIINNTPAFIGYMNSQLSASGARYGIGGYSEYRTIYSRSNLFGPSHSQAHRDQEKQPHHSPAPEPRRLHLGIDIWGQPHTKVMAPLDGFVHSFAFNKDFGDYGSTIILTHRLDQLSFYTLYGHLSLASITNLKSGDRVRRGDVFAEFGIPQENGGWPPHLHFQIIQDLQRMHGDYPGVCRLSEKDFYLNNCPDPDLILRMMRYAR